MVSCWSIPPARSPQLRLGDVYAGSPPPPSTVLLDGRAARLRGVNDLEGCPPDGFLLDPGVVVNLGVVD